MSNLFGFLFQQQLAVPWIVVGIAVLLIIYALIHLLYKCYQLIHVLWIIQSGKSKFTLKQKKWLEQFQDEADKKAKDLIDQKCNHIWRSVTLGKCFDTKYLQTECYDLIKQIAAVYYPSSKSPEFEVTILELLNLNQRITSEVNALLEPFPILHKVSVNTIIDTRSLLMRAQKSIDQSGLRTGGKVMHYAWMTINALKPQYWINKAIFTGAGEMVGRKILTAIYRIVGTEAIRVYKSSSKTQLDPNYLKKKIEEEMTLPSQEDAEIIQEAIEPETIHELPKDTHDPLLTTEEHSKADTTNNLENQLHKKVDEDTMTHEEATNTNAKQSRYETIAKTLSQFLEGSLHLWDNLVSKESIYKKFNAKGFDITQLDQIHAVPLEISDDIVDQYITKSVWYTTAEGAATGVGGLLLAGADAVSLLTIQLRTIQQIGYCYGFDVTRYEEKLFALKILVETYSHPEKKQRQTIIQNMRTATLTITGAQPGGMLYQKLFKTGITKAAQKIGLKLGGRYSAKLVPVLGSVAGGYINRKVTKQLMSIAKEVYRERREMEIDEKI